MVTIKGIKYASPGNQLIVELLSGHKLRVNSLTLPDEVIKDVQEQPIDLSTSYIAKKGLVIPNFKTIPLNAGNITKNWFKPLIIKWYYSDDDQIAVMLNNVGGDADDKQAYKDMQALRKASSKFANLLVERTNYLMKLMHSKQQEIRKKQEETKQDDAAEV